MLLPTADATVFQMGFGLKIEIPHLDEIQQKITPPFRPIGHWETRIFKPQLSSREEGKREYVMPIPCALVQINNLLCRLLPPILRKFLGKGTAIADARMCVWMEGRGREPTPRWERMYPTVRD
jgi:hypothetical protein